MVTPFALYYYSAYAPLLSAPSKLRATAWLAAFFLPHLSRESVPSAGGLIFLAGLVGFLVGALQIYYAKFRHRGVVKHWFYKWVRHPQYFYLAIVGFGLLIVWPRFILLIVYVHMLWFYYFLARSEEGRMHTQYGDSYLEFMRNTSMFIPREPGGEVGRLLFGWISNRRLRLLVIYCISLIAVIGGAFRLRELSLRLTTHLSSLDHKMAAVSFWRTNEAQLRDLVQAATNDREVHARLARQTGWIIVLAAERKGSVVHTMIDAGMTRRQAANVPVVDRETQLIFLRRVDQGLEEGPFSAGAHWLPVFIAQMESGHVNHLIDLDEHLFRANPVMPIF